VNRPKTNTFPIIKCFAVVHDLLWIFQSRHLSFKGLTCLTGKLFNNHILKAKKNSNLVHNLFLHRCQSICVRGSKTKASGFLQLTFFENWKLYGKCHGESKSKAELSLQNKILLGYIHMFLIHSRLVPMGAGWQAESTKTACEAQVLPLRLILTPSTLLCSHIGQCPWPLSSFGWKSKQ
jgi:hypothetical protein